MRLKYTETKEHRKSTEIHKNSYNKSSLLVPKRLAKSGKFFCADSLGGWGGAGASTVCGGGTCTWGWVGQAGNYSFSELECIGGVDYTVVRLLHILRVAHNLVGNPINLWVRVVLAPVGPALSPGFRGQTAQLC